jgi:hypothetical protein
MGAARIDVHTEDSSTLTKIPCNTDYQQAAQNAPAESNGAEDNARSGELK